jgi:methylated-DNA-[protein]-cysteine S-methyltransferase
MPSPLGELVIGTVEARLRVVEYADEWPAAEQRLRRRNLEADPAIGNDPTGTVDRLNAYFEGNMAAFDNLTLEPAGTPFQERVWRELRWIPPGQTITYSELAVKIDNLSAARAVGTACRFNPLAIIVPCHRVVSVHGDLRGYAGGVDRKRWLLAHETRHSSLDTD